MDAVFQKCMRGGLEHKYIYAHFGLNELVLWENRGMSG